jgi:hypothetical protein
MAWTKSGLYYTTFRDVLDTSQSALDLDLETHKIALYLTGETPNYSSETVFSATNEATGTNWPTGGVVVTGTTVSESPTESLMFDATDVSVASTTIATGAFGAKIYADAQADLLIVGINFGAGYTTSNGTFAIQWAAAGIFAIDLA